MVNGLTDYRSAIDALFARTTSGTKFGLERTEQLLAALGNPHRKFPSIHVAGTNGKGSVVATCDAILREKGLRVGRYTSPHLIDFRERILVSGRPIPEEQVLSFLTQMTDLSEKIGATFFELTTAMAFAHFAGETVDVAVIETGLGGRLDSTNVLDPRVAAVTSIGLDHTDLLGGTIEEIAHEKAGIFKRGRPAVIGEQLLPIARLLRDEARGRGADPIVVLDDQYQIGEVSIGARGTTFSIQSGDGTRKLLTPLLGEHQARNAAIAIATLRAAGDDLAPDGTEIEAGLAKTHLPGRFHQHGKYIFDVAHNPDAAATLARSIELLSPPRPRAAVLAVLSDKDWRGVITRLSGSVDRFVMTLAPTAPSERTWDPAAATEFARSVGSSAELQPDFDAALESSARDSAAVIVTGSFHTVGDAMSRLQVSPFEP